MNHLDFQLIDQAKTLSQTLRRQAVNAFWAEQAFQVAQFSRASVRLTQRMAQHLKNRQNMTLFFKARGA